MIKLKLLQELLNADEQDLKNIDSDHLRTALGAFRYFVRMLERELNQRSATCPIRGNIE